MIGAGPVGLTLACELLRHGVRCRIIDKAPAPGSTSGALGIFPRTLEVFQIMGIVDRVLEAGYPLAGVAIYNRTEQIGHIGFDALPSRYRFLISLPQSETERILNAHLMSFGTAVDRDRELIGLSQTPEMVRAVTRDSAGTEEISEVDWLIGCDGAHSSVRQLAGFAFEGGAYDETFVLADVNFSGCLDPVHLHMFLTDSGVVGIIPYGKGRCRVIANMTEESEGGLVRDPSLAEIQEIVRRRTNLGIGLTDAVWLSRFRIAHRKVPKFRIGRIFLAGDSAHVHSPAGGQGMNTGVQDSFNLGWKLGLVCNRKCSDSLLDSYNEEREPVAKMVLTLTDRLTRIIASSKSLERQLLSGLLPMLTGIHSVEDRIADTMAEIGIHYRRSSIVTDKSARALRAGDRAPDCEFLTQSGQRPVRLYELLRDPVHLLLLFAEPDSARSFSELRMQIGRDYQRVLKAFVVSPTSVADFPEALFDSGGFARTLYDAEPGAIVLIRPDGYIGFRDRAEHWDELRSYLTEFFSCR
ncbi:MAG TPA: FAD-dependent monooxygenase [Chthoniobacterales bacterium]|nr:FAD-dependent monooxygenase [Chthoniobacterales bacterium]